MHNSHLIISVNSTPYFYQCCEWNRTSRIDDFKLAIMITLFLPDEGDHSIIKTLQIKFVNNLSSACPNIELGITTTTTMTLKSYIMMTGINV